MTPNRPVPAVCLDLVHRFEGRRGTYEATRSRDPVGNWEIGWSHLLCGPEDPLWSRTLNAQQADDLARQDLDGVACELEQELPAPLVKALTENQWAALIDFTYNEGVSRVAGSTLFGLVKQYRFAEVPAQLKLWIWGHANGKPVQLAGLIVRRDAEAHIWLDQPWA